MRKQVFTFVITVFTVFSLAIAAWAGNVDTFGIGAKATALGGAFSAYADDPFAIYYNPAGLTQIARPMFSAGTNVMKPVIRVHDYQVTGMNSLAVPPDGSVGPADMYDQSRLLVVPHLGFAMPIGKGFSAGIAAYVPYGLDIQWDKDVSSTGLGSGFCGNPGAYNSYRSYYMREVVTPTVAYKVNDKFSIGAGISLGTSKSGVERLAFSPISSLHNKKIITDLEDDLNWSFNVGLMFKPIPSLAIGLTYRGRTDTEFEGTTEMKGAGTTIDIVGVGSNIPLTNTKVHAKTEIDHPEQLQAGVRYMPNDKFSVEADVVWTHWSVIDDYTVEFDRRFLSVEALGGLNPGRTEEHFERDWDDTIQFRLGAEWKVIPLVTLRGSYVYDPSPIPDDTMDIQWPDADKHTFALGTGLNFGHVSIDAAVQYSWIPERRKINGESDNLNDSYIKGGGDPQVSCEADGHLWGGALTVSYRF
jgi:long-chain fatty acid transport protein